MLIVKIYRFFTGKVKLKFSGDFVERVLNLCAYNGIAVWGIRKKNGEITLFMSISDFKRMRKILKNTGIRLHICKKRGVPFIINRYRYRYGILLGAAIFFATLQIMSGYIWNINVTGNSKISEKEVLAACEKIGVHEGIRATEIDAWNKRVELQTHIDGLAWAALNIEGCELTVDVKEAVLTPHKDYSPANLVANDDGIIKKIEVTEGEIKVAVGDSVAKNTLLVSGVVELEGGNTHLVKSSGKIVAEVIKRYKAVVPYHQKIKAFSGKAQQKYALNFFGIKIPLYLGAQKGEYVNRTQKLVIKNGRSYVPVFLYKVTMREIRESEIALSPDRAKEIAVANIKERIGDAKIVSYEESVNETEESLTVVWDVTLQKNIAKEEKILINTTN